MPGLGLLPDEPLLPRSAPRTHSTLVRIGAVQICWPARRHGKSASVTGRNRGGAKVFRVVPREINCVTGCIDRHRNREIARAST